MRKWTVMLALLIVAASSVLAPAASAHPATTSARVLVEDPPPGTVAPVTVAPVKPEVMPPVVTPPNAKGVTAPKNIVNAAIAAGQFKTLVSLLQKAGLVRSLQGGAWTVFAPTDAAFAKVPKATLARLSSDPVLLRKILLHHLVRGRVAASKVVTLNNKSVATASGAPLQIKVVDGKIFLNSLTRVTTADIKASNGYIHIVNKVLIPKT